MKITPILPLESKIDKLMKDKIKVEMTAGQLLAFMAILGKVNTNTLAENIEYLLKDWKLINISKDATAEDILKLSRKMSSEYGVIKDEAREYLLKV